jgi:uncharacterized Zn finger protein
VGLGEGRTSWIRPERRPRLGPTPEEYEQLDPVATLPVHSRLVEQLLVDAGAQNYQRAAKRLGTMRTLAAGTSHAHDVDAFITQLRATHRRRPRLLQEFDRAHLP